MHPTAHETADAAAYLARVESFLIRHAVEHSVLLTSAHRCAIEPCDGALWTWVEQEDSVVAAAQHTPPFPAYVSVADDDAVAALAGRLHERRPDLGGVGGMRGPAMSFARSWIELAGSEVTTVAGQGVYACDAIHLPADVSGGLRQAGTSDVDLVQRWADEFQQELDELGVPHLDVRPRVEQGLVWLWEAAEPVSLAMVSPAYGEVARVSLVYTPPARRRQGFAAACVAAVTQRELDQGHRCMLYTDLANPTANGVYRRIGYRQVAEAVQLRFG